MPYNCELAFPLEVKRMMSGEPPRCPTTNWIYVSADTRACPVLISERSWEEEFLLWFNLACTFVFGVMFTMLLNMSGLVRT